MPPVTAASVDAVLAVAGLDESIQRVAVAGVLKDKVVRAAKDALPEGAAVDFDFTARFTGHISKGFATVGQASQAPATCSLVSKAIVAELLRRLGVSPADAKKHLNAIVRASLKKSDGQSIGVELVGENMELQQAFDEAAKAAAVKLPPRVIPAQSRSAAVTVTGTCEVQA